MNPSNSLSSSGEPIEKLDEETKNRRDATCPCTVIAPCSKQCTCANHHMSAGCRRCATYGSTEQRTARAEWIAAAIDAYSRPISPSVSPTLKEMLDALQRTAQSLIGDSVQILTLEEITKRGDENSAARFRIESYCAAQQSQIEGMKELMLTPEEANRILNVVVFTRLTEPMPESLYIKLRRISSPTGETQK